MIYEYAFLTAGLSFLGLSYCSHRKYKYYEGRRYELDNIFKQVPIYISKIYNQLTDFYKGKGDYENDLFEELDKISKKSSIISVGEFKNYENSERLHSIEQHHSGNRPLSQWMNLMEKYEFNFSYTTNIERFFDIRKLPKKLLESEQFYISTKLSTLQSLAINIPNIMEKIKQQIEHSPSEINLELGSSQDTFMEQSIGKKNIDEIFKEWETISDAWGTPGDNDRLGPGTLNLNVKWSKIWHYSTIILGSLGVGFLSTDIVIDKLVIKGKKHHDETAYEDIYGSHKRYEEEDEEQAETDSQYNGIDYLEPQPTLIQTEDGELLLN